MTDTLVRPAPARRSTPGGSPSSGRSALLAVVLLVLVAGGVVLHDGGAQRLREVVTALPTGTAPEGVGNTVDLQPKVRSAVERAIAAAAAEGVEVRVTSGWRSAAHQQELYDEAVAKYGSPGAARQWVLPPGESEHVRGGAVDIGPAAGARWLDRNGVRFGLCRRYDNEPWHFERLAGAVGSVCPPREPHA